MRDCILRCVPAILFKQEKWWKNSHISAIIIIDFLFRDKDVDWMDKELMNEINTAYRLELKQAEIVHALFHRMFELEVDITDTLTGVMPGAGT